MDEFFEFQPNVSGVKGIVYIGEKILVKRRDDKTAIYPLKLDFPGGGIANDETPFETFRREAFEEFGVTIEPKNIVYVHRYNSRTVPGTISYFPVARLPAEIENNVKLGNEGLEWFLISAEDYLKDKDAVDFLVDRTKDYLANLDTSK